MYLILLALAVVTLANPAPEPTARKILPRHWPVSASWCIGSTKTLFGPYTLKYPIAGLDESDTFYAVELPDGTVELAVHGENDLPLSDLDEELVGDLGPDGLGGELVVTEVIDGKTYTLSLGGDPTPKCEPVIKKVKRGDPSFPTGAPVWPQEVFGRALEPEARVAAPEPTEALK